MGKAAAARKLAAAAAYGGGGLSVLGGALYGLLARSRRQLARKAIGEPHDDPPPDATGWYGRGRPGPAIKVALLGDSSAAGYGVDRVEDTPGAHLASGLAAHGRPPGPPAGVRRGRRPVRATSPARSTARSRPTPTSR